MEYHVTSLVKCKVNQTLKTIFRWRDQISVILISDLDFIEIPTNLYHQIEINSQKKRFRNSPFNRWGLSVIAAFWRSGKSKKNLSNGWVHVEILSFIWNLCKCHSIELKLNKREWNKMKSNKIRIYWEQKKDRNA